MHVSYRAFQTLTPAKQHVGLRKLPHIGSVKRGARGDGEVRQHMLRNAAIRLFRHLCVTLSVIRVIAILSSSAREGRLFSGVFKTNKMTQQHNSGSGGARKQQHTAGKTLYYIIGIL